MKQTKMSIITVDSGTRINRGYHNLQSNDEQKIMRFVFSNGFTLESGFTEDTHDIGDQEWDSSSFSKIDAMLQALSHSYGECHIQAFFCGEIISIYKPFPNICHGINFKYMQSLEQKLQPFFASFEKNFCYENIARRREDR